MKKVLLTTTAIVGLSAPAFAADPTAVSDQPYFHHSHPMTWSGSMSIKLTNPSTSAINTATTKAGKRDNLFSTLTGIANGEEAAVGAIANVPNGTEATRHENASTALNTMRGLLNAHASYTLAGNLATANVSAVEDIIDDFLGGSHSEAMDVLVEAYENGATPNGSASADLTADIKAFADAQDGNAESVETSPQLNTTASLGVAMSAGDGWTASTSGSLNLAGGTVSGGTVSMSNGTMTISVGKTQHAATAAVTTMYGMDVALDTNSARPGTNCRRELERIRRKRPKGESVTKSRR
jgi:hypothetical protein